MTNISLLSQPRSVAVAAIYQDGKYLMQLRDDIPGIFYPGVWGLFGGQIETGEEPKAAVKRELVEEINYYADRLSEFRCYADDKIIRHVFSCPLSVSLEQLELYEGYDLALLSPAEIERGYGYSPKAKLEKAIGDIHRQMMLDFIATQTA